MFLQSHFLDVSLARVLTLFWEASTSSMASFSHMRIFLSFSLEDSTSQRIAMNAAYLVVTGVGTWKQTPSIHYKTLL